MQNIIKCSNYIFFGLVLVAFTLASCSFADSEERASASRLEEKIGKEVVLIIANAEKVSAAKMVKNDENQYVMVPQQHQLSQNTANELRNSLLNDRGYQFDRTKKCLFVPEIAFQFEQVVVMVNLFCNQVKFIHEEKQVIIDYDPMAEMLNPFIREIIDQLDNQ